MAFDSVCPFFGMRNEPREGFYCCFCAWTWALYRSDQISLRWVACVQVHRQMLSHMMPLLQLRALDPVQASGKTLPRRQLITSDSDAKTRCIVPCTYLRTMLTRLGRERWLLWVHLIYRSTKESPNTCARLALQPNGTARWLQEHI